MLTQGKCTLSYCPLSIVRLTAGYLKNGWKPALIPRHIHIHILKIKYIFFSKGSEGWLSSKECKYCYTEHPNLVPNTRCQLPIPRAPEALVPPSVPCWHLHSHAHTNKEIHIYVYNLKYILQEWKGHESRSHDFLLLE